MNFAPFSLDTFFKCYDGITLAKQEHTMKTDYPKEARENFSTLRRNIISRLIS